MAVHFTVALTVEQMPGLLAGRFVIREKNHYYYYYYYYYYLALGPVLAGTRAQSGNRYGSGTLHSGQVLRGSLPLLSPVFRRSHFRRQMPPRPDQCERS
jgi:hypothetical protein